MDGYKNPGIEGGQKAAGAGIEPASPQCGGDVTDNPKFFGP